MNTLLGKVLTSAFILTALFSFAQARKLSVLRSFNYIVYYPDSTIHLAYTIKKGKIHGEAIEFDNSGNPVALGKYKNGLKDGRWLNRDGSSDYFEKGNWVDGMVPGCGYGTAQAQKRFFEIYDKFISRKN